MRRYLVLGIALLVVAGSSACTRMSVGTQHIPRRFYCRPDLPPGSEVELVRTRTDSLSGFNLMLIVVSRPEVYDYFRNIRLEEDEYITNVAITNTSASFLWFIYLFTIPMTQIEYDVVRVHPPLAAEEASFAYALEEEVP